MATLNFIHTLCPWIKKSVMWERRLFYVDDSDYVARNTCRMSKPKVSKSTILITVKNPLLRPKGLYKRLEITRPVKCVCLGEAVPTEVLTARA